MNVNISYAVNFDELPLEIKKLLEEARITVDNAMLDDFEEALNKFEDENYFCVLKSIEKVRKHLFKIDTRLQDCYGILAEYQRMLLVSEQEQEQEVESGEQLDLNFEGSDVVVDEDGNISVEKKNEEG
tara:strand:- start:1449 stop:1832 length:384 start_codon:yes stop_codon:yes gene_type:complete